jgi:hypothetical protein
MRGYMHACNEWKQRERIMNYWNRATYSTRLDDLRKLWKDGKLDAYCSWKLGLKQRHETADGYVETSEPLPNGVDLVWKESRENLYHATESEWSFISK